LRFVHRGVNYCNAVARAIVALLGRFLPRLGPLANASGPFFANIQVLASVLKVCLAPYSAAAR